MAVIRIAAKPRAFPQEGLAPAVLALILIDMQRDFLDPGWLSRVDGVLVDWGSDARSSAASRLLYAARRAV